MTLEELAALRVNQLEAKFRAEKKAYRPPTMQFTPAPHFAIEWTIQLPIPPSVNDWKTPIVRGPKPTMILTKAYRDWREKAHAAFDAFKVNGPLLRGPLEIAVTFRFATIASDIDGPLKPLLDAANGHLWVDDSHVCRIASVEKLLAGPNEAPHVVLNVRSYRSGGEDWDAEIVKRLAKSKRKAT